MTRIFTHQLEVRFRDCDAMGHVKNAVYLTYLEQARFAHWRANGLAGHTLDSAPADGGGPAAIPGVIVARVEIDYRRAARHADVLRVHLGVAAIGRTSFTYEYEIVDAADQRRDQRRPDPESDLSRGFAGSRFAGSDGFGVWLPALAGRLWLS